MVKNDKPSAFVDFELDDEIIEEKEEEELNDDDGAFLNKTIFFCLKKFEYSFSIDFNQVGYYIVSNSKRKSKFKVRMRYGNTFFCR